MPSALENEVLKYFHLMECYGKIMKYNSYICVLISQMKTRIITLQIYKSVLVLLQV